MRPPFVSVTVSVASSSCSSPCASVHVPAFGSFTVAPILLGTMMFEAAAAASPTRCGYVQLSSNSASASGYVFVTNVNPLYRSSGSPWDRLCAGTLAAHTAPDGSKGTQPVSAALAGNVTPPPNSMRAAIVAASLSFLVMVFSLIRLACEGQPVRAP